MTRFNIRRVLTFKDTEEASLYVGESVFYADTVEELEQKVCRGDRTETGVLVKVKKGLSSYPFNVAFKDWEDEQLVKYALVYPAKRGEEC